MVESEATLSLRSEFPVPPSCKWHFIRLAMWRLSGALAPSCLSEIHYQVGIRLSCCSCAAQAQRIMNNENSMDWRQTQLTGHAAAPAFHSAECDTCSSGRFSTSFTRACSVPRVGWGGPRLGCRSPPSTSSTRCPPFYLGLHPFYTSGTHPYDLKGAQGNDLEKGRESKHTPSSFMTEMEACGVRGNQLRDVRIFLEALITLILKSSLSLQIKLAWKEWLKFSV